MNSLQLSLVSRWLPPPAARPNLRLSKASSGAVYLSCMVSNAKSSTNAQFLSKCLSGRMTQACAGFPRHST